MFVHRVNPYGNLPDPINTACTSGEITAKNCCKKHVDYSGVYGWDQQPRYLPRLETDRTKNIQIIILRLTPYTTRSPTLRYYQKLHRITTVAFFMNSIANSGIPHLLFILLRRISHCLTLELS